MKKNQKELNLNKKVTRDIILSFLREGLQTEKTKFVINASEKWLSKYPGDLMVQYYAAFAFYQSGNNEEAEKILQLICTRDPEFIDAQELLVKVAGSENTNALDTLSCVRAMGKRVSSSVQLPEWSFIVQSAWQAYLGKRYQTAETLMQEVIAIKPELAFLGLQHLKMIQVQKDTERYLQTLEKYQAMWPDCIQLKILLADQLMNLNREAEAMQLLSKSAQVDLGGQVVRRLLGKNHRYDPMWLREFEIEFDVPVPIDIAFQLGWNRLPEGQQTGETETSQTIIEQEKKPGQPVYQHHLDNEQKIDQNISVDEKIRRDAVRQQLQEPLIEIGKKYKNQNIGKKESNFPVYVIMTTKSGLISKYGEQTASVVNSEMKKLAVAVGKKKGWGSMVFMPDDPSTAGNAGVETVESIDPWTIKLSLQDLDQRLKKKGSMIGALLIVGGPDLVPFHRLPNPTEDSDHDVPSDNPYGTSDGNYFVTEWPIGRLPGGKSGDVGLLLSQIRTLQENYENLEETEETLWQRILQIFDVFSVFKKLLNIKTSKSTLDTLGYSAAVWENASVEVYKAIAENQSVYTSPPENSDSIRNKKITSKTMTYFNLHGVEDGPNWYGQKAYNDTTDAPDYPVALKPEDVKKNGLPPQIVFSEACYGANIYDKNEEDALSLKFLGIGVKAFVGSTCVSYGSISKPLIAADLLAKLFWNRIQNGELVGEALMYAKIDFVKIMNKRQGFLDGEDQKTLLSFVLYGDPLTKLESKTQAEKSYSRPMSLPLIKTMCDSEEQNGIKQVVSKERLLEVKEEVEQYLPGLEQSRVLITKQKLLLDEGFHKDFQHTIQKKAVKNHAGQYVITFSKDIKLGTATHRHFARAKINAEGKLVNVAVSR